MSEEKVTQCARLAQHMKTRSISPGEALLVYGITRLAARIYDLRLAGYRVSMKMHSDPLGRKYARYRLKR